MEAKEMGVLSCEEKTPSEHKDSLTTIKDKDSASTELAMRSISIPPLAAPTTKRSDLFKEMSANEWIHASKLRPIPKMLFDVFWFEGELCILFSDTNLGKSILAVQIADSISKGIPIKGSRLEALPQTVLYFDFEMSPKQFEGRYSESYKNHYVFDDKFRRVEIDSEGKSLRKLEKKIIDSIENMIQQSDARVVIIDNITWLTSKLVETADASKLMMALSRLKKKYGMSMLVLAHTPKRDDTKKLTVNDLGGSKMISNFADSILGIGLSHRELGLRYFKQIKQRSVELTYGEGNVLLCKIRKPDNFIHFEIQNPDCETYHLKARRSGSIDIKKVVELRKTGLSNVKIGHELGVTEGAIRKALTKAPGEDTIQFNNKLSKQPGDGSE